MSTEAAAANAASTSERTAMTSSGTSEPTAANASSTSVPTVEGALAGLGCALGLLGVLLDWVTVTGPVGGGLGLKGTDTDDGKIALALVILAFAATLFAAMFGSRVGFIIVWLLGAACLAIAIIDGRDATNRLANVNIDAAPAGFFHGSVGIGLWLLGIGGALMLVASLMASTVPLRRG